MKKESAGYNPLRFFWIATYDNGECLPQFDPETGLENLFSKVDHSKLVKFGWHPFSLAFAHFLIVKGHNIWLPTPNRKPLPSFELELQDGQRLIAFRRQKIRYSMTGRGQSRETVYALGWWRGTHNNKIQTIMFIKENGSVVMTDDYQKVV